MDRSDFVLARARFLRKLLLQLVKTIHRKKDGSVGVEARRM